MSSKNNKKNRSLIVGGILILVIAVIALEIFALFSLAGHIRKDIADSKAVVCPRIYENDFFQFEHPCNISVFTAEDGKSVRILDFTRQGAHERYLFVQTLTESELTDLFERYGGSFSECASGDEFTRWKEIVFSINGASHEACLQGEHGGTRIIIRSDRPDFDYIVISEEGGSLDGVIPTLRLN